MLVSITVLLIILSVVFSITQQVTGVYHNSVGKFENLEDARNAFTSMTQTISEATLNTYYDYYGTASGSATFRTPSNSASFIPTGYKRQSDLHFISGNTKNSSGTVSNTYLANVSQIAYPITHSIFFEAPMGSTDTSSYKPLNSTLNACGFYVCYGPDVTVPSFLSATTVPTRYRYRLMQFTQPTEYLSIYDTQTQGASAPAYNQWFLGPLAQDLASSSPTSISQLAQNVVALIILPKLSTADQVGASALAPNYDYDSRNSANTTTYNQLPPIVQVTMVALDETSAFKLGNTATPPNLTAGASFTTAANMDTDMATLESNLSASAGNAAGNHVPLHFEVFQSNVALQSAKWSP